MGSIELGKQRMRERMQGLALLTGAGEKLLLSHRGSRWASSSRVVGMSSFLLTVTFVGKPVQTRGHIDVTLNCMLHVSACSSVCTRLRPGQEDFEGRVAVLSAMESLSVCTQLCPLSLGMATELLLDTQRLSKRQTSQLPRGRGLEGPVAHECEGLGFVCPLRQDYYCLKGGLRARPH